MIDIWDLRKDDKPVLNFFAHEKSVNCLDWHHSDENVIITGSNDKSIRVWNLKEERSTQKLQPIFQIYTGSSVKKCQWVPQHQYLIASCSSTAPTVNVWHCQKQYIQQYIYKHQKDPIQDFEWLSPNEQLLTAYNKTVCSVHISTAVTPYESMCFSSVAFNTRNELGVLNEHFNLRSPPEFIDKLDSQLAH